MRGALRAVSDAPFRQVWKEVFDVFRQILQTLVANPDLKVEVVEGSTVIDTVQMTTAEVSVRLHSRTRLRARGCHLRMLTLTRRFRHLAVAGFVTAARRRGRRVYRLGRDADDGQRPRLPRAHRRRVRAALSHTHAHALSRARARSCTRSLTLAHALARALAHALAHALSRTRARSLTRSVALFHAHAHAHASERR
eukprot:363695-Pleurochrysis_carterae.AAC.3